MLYWCRASEPVGRVLLEGLSVSNRESPLSGPLLTLLEIIAEESQVAAPAGEVMPEPVAPGDVAAAVNPRGIFATPWWGVCGFN